MTHPLQIEDGHLIISDRPGLGSDLIEEDYSNIRPGIIPARVKGNRTLPLP